MKKLPIGIQTFSSIIDGDFVYIDKTPGVLRMLEGSGRYFLSRPRRFGKSLLLDTLKSVFEGKKELFDGLFIADKWDWNQTWPVIKIDFADGSLHSREALDLRINKLLQHARQNLGLENTSQTEALTKNDIPGQFADLIIQTRQKYKQQVVILIDEYDKPILDNIDQPEIAAEMREGLKNLYSVMKGQDAHIRFIFMTGVTKFSKVSLFSGINQIEDITLDQAYASICGYTQQDLETEFSEHLEGVDLTELKEWYNGYHFMGEAVYNPYDILLFLAKDKLFRNYWFETGSPEFLIRLFKKHRYFLPNLEGIEVGEEILNSFDIETINPVTLLFQAGYLTISDVQTRRNRMRFRLEMPNQEVRISLSEQLIDAYSGRPAEEKYAIQDRLYDALEAGNLEQLKDHIVSLFAGIQWRNFTHNDLPDSEGYYASVLYAFFSSLNAHIIPEDISNKGQADITIQLGNYIYVLEIKRDTSEQYQTLVPNTALTQILDKEYVEKYKASGKTVFAVGMIFNTQQRQLVQMDWQEISKG